MQYELHEIARAAKSRYPLSLKGIHGIAHWQRVQENGLRLAKHNGANKDIVKLFAMLHDCCREDDGYDPEHGPRAAEFTMELRDQLITASDEDFEKLLEAIRDHTTVKKSKDLDIATCWDADRLDIGRVGLRPRREYLNTDIARQERVMKWAYKRSQV